MDQVTFFLRGLGRFVGSVDSLAKSQNFQTNNQLLKLMPGLAKQIFGSTVGGWPNWPVVLSSRTRRIRTAIKLLHYPLKKQ